MDEDLIALRRRVSQLEEQRLELKIELGAAMRLACEAMARTFPDPQRLEGWAGYTERVVMDAVRRRGDTRVTAAYQSVWDEALANVRAYRRSADSRSLPGAAP